jgi:hypothetical protein
MMKSQKFTQHKFNKSYATQTERDAAVANFAHEQMACMEQELKFFGKQSDFLMRVNYRSDQSLAMKSTWRGLRDDALVESRSDNEPEGRAIRFPPAPKSLDYRDLGFVTDVLDQGYFCGACYSYGSMCALEGQFAKRNLGHVQLSVQSLIDCSRAYGNMGCDGGYVDATFRYVIQQRGVQDHESYPYEGSEDRCRYNGNFSVGKMSGFSKLTGNEEYLKRALAHVGPLAVGIKGDLLSFYDYFTGVYDDPECHGGPNHVVCLVGEGFF